MQRVWLQSIRGSPPRYCECIQLFTISLDLTAVTLSVLGRTPLLSRRFSPIHALPGVSHFPIRRPPLNFRHSASGYRMHLWLLVYSDMLCFNPLLSWNSVLSLPTEIFTFFPSFTFSGLDIAVVLEHLTGHLKHVA
jgi:hypothetical protein